MTEIISNIIKLILDTIINLMPEIEIDPAVGDNVSAAVEKINESMGIVAFFFPVKTALTIFGIILAIIMTKFGIFLVNWVIKRIRGG